MKRLEVGDTEDYQTTRMAAPTACETHWMNIPASFERHRDAIIAGHPKANEEIGLVYIALITIVQLARTSPSVNRNGIMWMNLADKAEVEKRVLREHYEGKALYAGLYHL
jgi:hypothetical protein